VLKANAGNTEFYDRNGALIARVKANKDNTWSVYPASGVMWKDESSHPQTLAGSFGSQEAAVAHIQSMARSGNL
jgi:hypothetical protein